MRRVSQYSAVAGILFLLVLFLVRRNAVDFRIANHLSRRHITFRDRRRRLQRDGVTDLAVANAGRHITADDCCRRFQRGRKARPGRDQCR
jgi:hypothetical protein